MTLIRKPQDIEIVPTIKVLIYGQPGIGKTTLALSAPSPLHLDFDGGVHRVKPQHQADTVQVRSWEDIEEVLKENLSAYKTIIIDTAGKLLDFMNMAIVKDDPKLGKRDGSITLQGYGVRKVKFQNFVGKISTMGKHLVFVAHDREEKDGDTKIIRPEIGGSSGGDLIKEIDLVGYMEAIGKKRTVSFDPCEKFYGKNTCDLPAIIELKDLNKDQNNQLTEIFTTYTKSLEKGKDVFLKYSDLIEGAKETIETYTSIENLNECFAPLLEGCTLLDSKLQVGLLLNKKASELGARFDKKEGHYVKI